MIKQPIAYPKIKILKLYWQTVKFTENGNLGNQLVDVASFKINSE